MLVNISSFLLLWFYYLPVRLIVCCRLWVVAVSRFQVELPQMAPWFEVDLFCSVLVSFLVQFVSYRILDAVLV